MRTLISAGCMLLMMIGPGQIPRAIYAAEPNAAAIPDEIGPGITDAAGIITHSVRSPLQSGPTEIRVLLPIPYDASRRYPVVYVLPVEAGRESRYGDGLDEILKHKLHEKFAALFVAPTFAELPWYADHPTRKDCRQESYFVRTVVPAIDKTYPTTGTRQGRLLLGFSKSGWGAWSLLLRHPDLFEKAAAWDAPLMMDRPGQYGSGPIFGTEENFARYQLTKLLQVPPPGILEAPRLILTSFGNFRNHHLRMSELLTSRKIPHHSVDGPMRAHGWHSGWVQESLELLLSREDASP